VDEDELVVRLAIAGRILDVQAELEEMNARLQEMASLDPLTGLANRRRLAEGIDAATAGAGAASPLSVLAIDIDHFKSYNDEYGHLAGDDVLRTVAATLQANTRAGDLVARFGGEEFVVLLPGVNVVVATRIAEGLRAALESHRWPHRLVTASFGIATAWNPAEIADFSLLLSMADRALYHSKESGRNRVTHASSLSSCHSHPSAGSSPSPPAISSHPAGSVLRPLVG
jgi:diguanylate cyclase (GGDEF)-like protein